MAHAHGHPVQCVYKYSNHSREHEEKHDDEEEEDMVEKAEKDFFSIVDTEKKAREDADAKREAALNDVKKGIAQEGTTHDQYQENGTNETEEPEVC